MPAVLHVLSDGGCVDVDVVVTDVLEHSHPRRPHFLVGVDDAVPPDAAASLGGAHFAPLPGHRLKAVAAIAQQRALQALVRELLVRHRAPVVLHGHGPTAANLVRLAGYTEGVATVVDDGPPTPLTALLPPAQRLAVTCHGDLDRALEAGVVPRDLALVPPGVEAPKQGPKKGTEKRTKQSQRSETPATLVVAGDTPLGRALVDVLLRRGDIVVVADDVPATLTPGTPGTPGKLRRVVVGPGTRLSGGLCRLISAGVPVVGVHILWADEVGRGVLDVGDLPLAEQVEAALSVKPHRPHQLPKGLGARARAEALDELYDQLAGPREDRYQRGPMGQRATKKHPPRRRHP